MNIHFYAGDRLTATEARRRGLTIGSGKGTNSPRTRDNTNTALAHNAYPGGKISRKAQAALSARVKSLPVNKTGFQTPGSLRG